MKTVIAVVFCAVLVLPALVSPLHASAEPSQEGGPLMQQGGAAAQGNAAAFTDVERKEWFLSEIRSGGNTLVIDRAKLEADNMGGYFTVNFQDGRVIGVGAPNRYFGPFSVSNMTLRFGNLASTMMMAFKEPEGLNESGYFAYLNKVTRWNLAEGRLELYSSDNSGSEAVLVFDLK